MSFCKAVIEGNVCKEPEKRFTSANIAVTTFSINVPSTKNDGPNIVRVVTWRNLAENCAETILKDQRVIVEGRLQINSYKDQEGAEKKVVEIDAVNVEIVSADAGSSNNQTKQAEQRPVTQKTSQAAPPPVADEFDMHADELIDEDEIPF